MDLRSQRGQTLPIVAVFMVCIVALAGLAIDVGNLEHVKAQMQAAADASATAGADSLLDTTIPQSSHAYDVAEQFGMGANGSNQVLGVVRKSVEEDVQVDCDHTYGDCNPSTDPNVVDVKDSADVPLFFLSLFGMRQAKVSVEAEACAPCATQPHDVMLVLDHTGSMQDTANAANGLPKIDNLKDALLEGLLPSLNPLDHVGLVVFPPVAPDDPICNEKDNWHWPDTYTEPDREYLVQPLAGGFLSSSGALNPASPLVTDIGCLVPAGDTDYADPLLVAQQELAADGRAGVQRDIVLISDGAADRVDDPACDGQHSPDPWDCLYPCNQGIQNATQIKQSGTDIWAIAYGNFGGDIQCAISKEYFPSGPHPPQMDGYAAMSQIATPGDYLQDPDPESLAGILHTVAGALSDHVGSRLVK